MMEKPSSGWWRNWLKRTNGRVTPEYISHDEIQALAPGYISRLQEIEMEGWRREYEEFGDPGNLIGAIRSLLAEQWPVPAWLAIAICDILEEKRGEGPGGSGKLSIARAQRENNIRLIRRDCVMSFLEEEGSVERAAARASTALAGTDAQGGEETMEKAYYHWYKPHRG